MLWNKTGSLTFLVHEIMKAMRKYYPIAAVDVETAKYYKTEDMTKMKLESMFCNEKLSDII